MVKQKFSVSKNIILPLTHVVWKDQNGDQ